MKNIIKWFVIICISLQSLLSSVFLFFLLVFVPIFLVSHYEPYPPKSDNPNDIWIGGSDGGVFLEITSANPPYYCVRIKTEMLYILDSGQIYFNEGDLTQANFNVYLDEIVDGKNGIMLKNYQKLIIEPNKNCE
ncbi:hypothetical protein RCS94_07115 [Orbaceae bacterium ac157xtp]